MADNGDETLDDSGVNSSLLSPNDFDKRMQKLEEEKADRQDVERLDKEIAQLRRKIESLELQRDMRNEEPSIDELETPYRNDGAVRKKAVEKRTDPPVEDEPSTSSTPHDGNFTYCCFFFYSVFCLIHVNYITNIQQDP